MNEGLRPREIQSRIRAGQSSEQIAADAGMPIELVARFEAPVLAERAHVAERARRTEVRHSTPGLTVDDAVTEALRARGVNPDTADWDSWRRDDGRWTVSLEFGPEADRKRAMWTYDLVARAVVPDDEQARSLIDPTYTAPPETPPRLVSVPTSADEVYDHDRVERSVEAVTEVVEVWELNDEIAQVDETITTTSVVETEILHIEHVEEGPDGTVVEIEAEVVHTHTVTDTFDTVLVTEVYPPAEPEPVAVEAAEPAATSPAPRPRPKNKRASVPSWDEILFGGDGD